jgi:probable phosphoglycerate mutase
MTYLVLVRHGETIWHAENRYAGRSDVPLTDRGRRQADRLAGWAATARLDGIWCSPLSRARVTAQACAAATGLSEQVDERLRELDFGEAEGLTSAEMADRFPDEVAAFRADPVAHHLPGGEDPKLLVDRFLDCLHDIAAAHPGGRVLVVAHTTAIRLALCALIGVPLANYRRTFPFVRNCGLTEVLLDGEHAGLCQFNTPIEPDAPRFAG